MRRRAAAILLALCMALTLLPTAAFATEEGGAAATVEQPAQQEAKQEEQEAQSEEPEQPEAKPEEQSEEPAAQEAPAVQSDEAGIALLAGHSHCICGGSVTAGDHTSHSDVAYTAWNGTDSITYTNNVAYFYLTCDATINNLVVSPGKTLYLCLGGKTYKSNGTSKINVGDSSKKDKTAGHLILCDCQGGGTIQAATKGWGGMGVYLYNSTLDMFGGKLTGGKVTKGGGGGAIALDDKNCVFNMYGGEISGNDGKNYGGAIFQNFAANKPNATGGNFNMYGGVIKNNSAKNGGAFFSTTGGTINMTGGTISGNKTTQSSNDAGGGAIYMRGNGTINISGSAEITGNSSNLDGGAILMGWGAINISDSVKINNNTANRWGGAICLRQDSNQSTTLYMKGGEISGNKATKEGGAVHVLDKGCQFFLDDGKITGNTSGDGGAIYLNQEPSWLIMKGGEISGNTATGNGGGVYIYRTGSVCQLYGGKIENNKASGNGGGIYINPSNNGQLRLGDKPLVQNNTVSGKVNNVYLPSDKTLTIEIGMSKGSSVGVTTADTSYPVAFSNAYKNNYADYFFADDANAHVEYKEDQKLYLVANPVGKTLTVKFVANGDNVTGMPADMTVQEKSGMFSFNIPTAVPTRDGYHFTYWSQFENGSLEGDWKPGDDVKFRAIESREYPLYAVWEAHSGGTATCTAKAKCSTCNAEYGEKLPHDFTALNTIEKYRKSTATCIKPAVYYKSCTVCGLSSAGTADEAIFKSGEKDPHNHAETLGEWQSDENNHWKEYSCCHVRAEEGHHDWDNGRVTAQPTCTKAGEKTYTCTKCGKIKTERIDATGHNWKSEWESDATHHWHECANGCDEKGDYKQHTGGEATCTAKAVCEVCNQAYGALKAHDFTAEKAEEQYLKSAATCTEKAVYYKSCTVCGEKGTETFTFGDVLDHDWDKWTSNGDGTHTRTCKRNDKHTETKDCSGGEATCTDKAVCKDCKAEYGEKNPANHVGTEQWTKTAATHEKKWSCCGAVIVPESAHNWADGVCRDCGYGCLHADADKDHVCDTCGKTISDHVDEDKDHVCDYCKKTVSDHVDADKDHVCDYCKKTISDHEDANKDHVCDYCEKTISNHEDANKDHVCDYCEKVISNHADTDTDHVCDYCGKTISDHVDADKDHVCDYCGKTISNHTGGTADCCHKAVCDYCGKAYGGLDPNNHTDLKHFPAKSANRMHEGNIEYWYCSGCGKYFKDADATIEITQEDTVIPKVKRENGSSTPTEDTTGKTDKNDKTVKSQNTGDMGVALYSAMALLSLTGGAWVVGKKRRP